MRTISPVVFGVIAAAAFGAALATPALAQDGPFTGPRVEAIGGYENLKDGGDGDSEGRDGLTYGALIGYDIQRGGAVFGIEGEIADSTVRARTGNAFAVGDEFRIDAGRDLYVGGRIGTAISPVALLYAKAGYTNARIDSRYTTTSGNVTTTIRDDVNLDGVRVGAGLEYKLTPSAFVKGEYRYSHYGKIDGYDVDLDRHQLMAGVGFRF